MSHNLRKALLGASALALASVTPGLAQDVIPGEIDLIVGSSPGGGYDTYARLVASHLPDYLEGSPSIVVQNMPGAGSALATEYIGNSRFEDGLTIGAIFPGAVLGPVLTDDFEGRYDPQALQYLATANVLSRVCAVYERDASQDIEDLRTRPLILGADAPGGGAHDYAYLFRNAANNNVEIVPGYPGTREIYAAMERGEVDGLCGNDFSSLRSMAGSAIDDGDLTIIVQFTIGEDSTLDGYGAVPFEDLIDEQDRDAVELIMAQQVFGRPYVVGPDVPEETVEALRTAFVEMFEDPDFQAEAERLQLDLSWADGDELTDTIETIFAADTDVIARARALLAAD